MQLYDTLTRGKQELPPAPGPIRMYTCGPTVYQRIHIGNARPFLISMWLRRWLVERGYDVDLVETGEAALVRAATSAHDAAIVDLGLPGIDGIEVLSQGMTLLPGDIIATGTPEGVGAASGNFLKAGDRIEAEVEHIGILHSKIVRP